MNDFHPSFKIICFLVANSNSSFYRCWSLNHSFMILERFDLLIIMSENDDSNYNDDYDYDNDDIAMISKMTSTMKKVTTKDL